MKIVIVLWFVGFTVWTVAEIALYYAHAARAKRLMDAIRDLLEAIEAQDGQE